MEIKVNNANEPVWGEMSIKTKLPPNLEPLNDLAQNVYWSWNHDVRELFKSIDRFRTLCFACAIFPAH